MNKVKNEFLGCTSAVCICNEYELNTLKEFLGANNLFDKDGNIASQISAVSHPTVFYRDSIGLYVNQASEQEVRSMNYQIKTFAEMFSEPREQVVEQRSLFGGDEAPGIRPPDEDLIQPEPLDPIDDPMMDEPIDVEAREVKNELSLKETLNQLTIGTLIPAHCDGNLLDLKDKIIDIVQKKKDIAVTKDNFTETKEVVTDLNAKAKTLKDQRAVFNKEIKRFTEPYSNAFSEIINALENASKTIKSNISVYEDEERKAIKKKILDEWINPTLELMIQNGVVNKEIASQFLYDDSWSKQSSFTKKKELVKKVADAINTELERLTNIYELQQKDIETIKSTINQLKTAHNLDAQLSADTYIELYKKGSSMPEVQERINQDLSMIKKAVELNVKKEVEKAQNSHSQQQSVQQAQQPETIQKVDEAKENQSNVTFICDDKTGEVVAKADSQKLMALVIQTPEKYQGRTFEYTYTFSGSFGAIKTFSNLLKLLSMMFKDFKYERK